MYVSKSVISSTGASIGVCLICLEKTQKILLSSQRRDVMFQILAHFFHRFAIGYGEQFWDSKMLKIVISLILFYLKFFFNYFKND